MEEKTYKILRYFRDLEIEPEERQTGLTLDEAKAHCRDPSTKGDGWFDGFVEE